MKLPWISRFSHEAIVNLLSTQVGELKEERKLLVDRLATLGLGGPIFSIPAPEIEEEPEEEVSEMKVFRNRPTKIADALTTKLRRDAVARRPSTAWVPDLSKAAAMMSVLDKAEKEASGH